MPESGPNLTAPPSAEPDFKERRVFFSDPKTGKHFQIFKFIQKNDASIYVASPNFGHVKLLHLVHDGGGSKMAIHDSPGEGKISFHGSGLSLTRPYDDPNGHQLIVRGNFLLNMVKKSAGLRHLFTAFFSEPTNLPITPAFQKKGDYAIRSDSFLPHVFIFFAVPRVNPITVEISASFDVADLESVPPASGFGSFSLKLHTIVWFAYRTKYMNRWPTNTHIAYQDGHIVPLWIGSGEGQMCVKYSVPQMSLNDQKLFIRMNAQR